MKMKRLMLSVLPVAAAVVSVAVLLAGCGGGEHHDDDSSPVQTVCGVRGELLPELLHQRQQGGPEVAAVLACPAVVAVVGARPDRRAFMVLFQDAADDADYLEALQYRHSYGLDSRGVQLHTDEPSPAQARLILVDVLGTDRIEELRVLR